jgi:hypothetical protein
MKYRLCVLLALLQGPVVAEPASPPETPRGLVDPGVFSELKSLPEVNPALVRSDAKKGPLGSGLLAGDIVFPAPARVPVQAAPGGAAVRSAVRDPFRFEPSSYSPPAADEEMNAGSITVMEPIHVPGSKVREMADAIDFAQDFRRASTFHVTTGGRLASLTLGDYGIDFGLWRHESLIAEETHVGLPTLVIDLVHVRW